MLAFISYARTDLAAVEQLRDSMQILGWQVWIDLQTGGGRDWWTAILTRIRACDLFVVALSPNSLASPACTRERDYATVLGKPLLPVGVATVATRTLPAALARLNIVDLTRRDYVTGLQFATAVHSQSPAPALPDPLPVEPPIPLSYLAQLSEDVYADILTFQQQMALTAMLRDALAQPADHDDALALVKALIERDDLYARAHRQLQDLLTTDPPSRRPTSPVHQPHPRPSRINPFPATTAQTLRTLNGHTGSVLGVAFSPDGGLLATAGRDKTVRLWIPSTGDHILTLTGHDTTVYAVAFSPDRPLLATASADRTVQLWNPATGDHILTLKGHVSNVYAVAFSPDGAMLATASGDNTVGLWSPTTGDHIRTLTGHTDFVLGVAFSPDGAMLATASADNTVRLWDPTTGDHTRTLTGHTSEVNAVAFSPEGTLLATASDDNTVQLWNPTTGDHTRTLTGHTALIYGVAFSPDGGLLATASWDHTVRLWNPSTGHDIHTLTGHIKDVNMVAFSPDGTLLVTTSDDNTIRLWS